MSQRALEQRVATLEQKVAELEAAVANGAGEKDWRTTIGMFSGDEVMRRICDEALKYREKDREKARRRYARSGRKQA
jgi:hypothetical protein